MTAFLLLYLLLINALTMLLMLADKSMARKNLWRIPESTLLTAAAFGGSIGALAGMYLFRHKTRHLKFTLGVPAILMVQVACILWLFLGI